ncbi:MAG TPA: hypothetical protein VIH10_17735 [Kribbella sp.]
MTGLPELGTAISTTTLRHNPLNAVTATVERVTYSDGRTAVRKELRKPVDSTGPWAASTDPRHWNYWRRELEVYQDDELRSQLADAGLVLPQAEIVEHPTVPYSSSKTSAALPAPSSVWLSTQSSPGHADAGRRGRRPSARGPRPASSATTPRRVTSPGI